MITNTRFFPSRRLLLALLAAGLAAASFDPALAQAPRRGGPAASTDAAAKEQPSEKRLPADVTTDHAVELPGRTLRFKATAGSLPINNEEGKTQAEIAYVAYVQPDVPARPLTFVFNGGPGAASAYLNIGALGPWRLPLDGITPSSPTTLVPNAETWLDFTDLVFVDPVGAGYSRFVASGDEVRKQFWSVDGDIDVLSTFMRKWIEKNGRQASKKFITGESYGGFRAPKLAARLRRDGFAVSGLVMISPVIDFGWRGNGNHSPLGWVSRLPSMAATAREATAPFDREALREAERYAATDYLADLMRGEHDKAAVERMTARLSQLTGLDPALVRRLAGRIDMRTFLRERTRDRGLVGSMYDATVTGLDSEPSSSGGGHDDAVLSVIGAPLTSAMSDLYARVLNWRVDDRYALLGAGALGMGRRALDARGRRRPALVPGDRSAHPRAGDPWGERSGHALFREPADPRSDAGLRRPGPAQARGLWRRPHVLQPRGVAPRVPRGRPHALSGGRGSGGAGVARLRFSPASC